MLKRRLLLWHASTLILLSAVVAFGCSSEGEGDIRNASDFDGSLARCLEESGAEFADSSGDLKFLSIAESEDTASLFGSTYEESSELFVDLLQDGDDPREWLVWVAQPFDQERSPFEIAESGSNDSFVAYALEPTPEQRRELKDCTA